MFNYCMNKSKVVLYTIPGYGRIDLHTSTLFYRLYEEHFFSLIHPSRSSDLEINYLE